MYKMVLSGSSKASHIASISNQNQGGGSKKAGLPVKSPYLLTHRPRELNTVLNNTLSRIQTATCSHIGGIRTPRC